MNIDKIIIRFAGLMVLIGIALGYYVHEGFFLLSAFVGLNLVQASFTGFCPLAMLLKKLGVKSGTAF